MEKYGDVPLRFESYYKYSFTFVGVADDVLIIAAVGGAGEDIYRYTVKRDDTITLRGGDWSFAQVKRGADELWSEYEA